LAKVILYIACSIDGFIAKADGNLEWLNSIPNPDNIDHGYSDFLKGISIIIMGRRTYSEVLGFGIDWPYSDRITYVVTNNDSFKIETPETYILKGNIVETVNKFKLKSRKDIWLVGGGQLVTFFLNNNLIDKMIISFIPTILGQGIPLFPDKPKETMWNLINNIAYSTGIVTLTYEKNN
jgi:dihydrofolate reductase